MLFMLLFCASAFAEQHFYILKPFAASRIPLPEYLTQTAKDVVMVDVRLQRPDEAFRLRVWYTCKLPSGIEMTYERRIDVDKNELWATAVFGGDEEPRILECEFVRVHFKEQLEGETIAESVSEAGKP